MSPRLITIQLLGLFFFVTVTAYAMPEYALKEHKQCIYCHFDPKGGGPTNAAGRYYSQHFTLEGYRTPKKVLKKRSPPPAPRQSD